MTKIEIEIKSCKECPFFSEENPFSSDGWDRMIDWVCTKKVKNIAVAVEWHEDINVPEWCPIKIQNDKK